MTITIISLLHVKNRLEGKCSALYGRCRFITLLIRSWYFTLSSGSWIQSLSF